MQIELAKLSGQMLAMRRTGKVALMVALDCAALPFCFLVAMLLLAADLRLAPGFAYYSYVLMPLTTLAVFALAGLYQAVIRFIDRSMLIKTGMALALAVTVSFLLSYALDERTLPRGALIIYWFIVFSYVVCSRLTVRAILRNGSGLTPAAREKVGIFGAGEAGVRLAQAMRAEGKYQPVCFFDDQQEVNNRNVAGIKVFHARHLASVASAADIRTVVLALPSAPPERCRQLVQAIRSAGLTAKMLNGLDGLLALSDTTNVTRAIREVCIEDLLGRAAVPPRPELFSKCVQDRNVLVTGAGGSIGSALCRQILTLAPRHLHLLEHSEFALYAIEQELRSRSPDIRLHAHLGSVCDYRLMDRVVCQGGIDTIYHAAAYKHVPVVECNMAEGIRNNVVGAQVTARVAAKHGVSTCVLVSTDKAVRPTNIMGASKRIAELIRPCVLQTSWVPASGSPN